MTKELKDAFNNKRDYWFRCLNSAFKSNKQIKKQVKNNVRVFEENLALNSRNNPKNVYSYMNSQTRVKESIKAIKLTNGNITTDIQEIVNELTQAAKKNCLINVTLMLLHWTI
jgi:hypothetical protein